MKKSYLLLLLLYSAMVFSSCQNKTKTLIAKKWDCVQIENLAPLDKHFATPQDSIATIKAEAALQTLVWTFNYDNSYSCSISSGTATQGTYEISEDEKSLILSPLTKNNINRYIITALSENELVLTSTGIAIPVIMHFRPH